MLAEHERGIRPCQKTAAPVERILRRNIATGVPTSVGSAGPLSQLRPNNRVPACPIPSQPVPRSLRGCPPTRTARDQTGPREKQCDTVNPPRNAQVVGSNPTSGSSSETIFASGVALVPTAIPTVAGNDRQGTVREGRWPAASASDPSSGQTPIRHNVTGGRVEISTAVVNGRATLSVINTGPITPWAEVDRLFQLFERLDPDRSHKRGHGLGLSIVAAIATGLKGPLTGSRQVTPGRLRTW